ncbi:polysaccharide deacetylase family protein [Robertkochia aurantiaca]|uniref:polysaccharide deacetylase family protein n=1 Tax=Robertkochia aurantiaca TaxID=2873700 RepID=UPI001CCD8A51|nr:polysaccharide deacetylase family protein [Robertkochia sp. 3YJGBD-33]
MGRIFPNLLWRVPPANNKQVYLTFDDGPIPEVTDFVLEELKRYGARATFFCIGDNVRKYPEIYRRIRLSQHQTGNHTFNHLNAWKHDFTSYIDNVQKTQVLIESMDRELNFTPSKLFRPPYGRLTNNLSRNIRGSGLKIVMWDVLSADFDQSLTHGECTENCMKHIEPGSIVIFHDSIKAFDRLKKTLPAVLKFLKDKGYSCEVL